MSERAPARAVLFDLDGTLVDSLPTIARGMSEVLGEYGHEIEADRILPMIGAPMQLLAQELTGVSDEVADEIYERYLERYYAEFIETTEPIEGANELLERLGPTPARLAVVTNKNEQGGRMMVAIQGWEHHFESVVGRDTAARPKPAPDAPLHALATLGVAPSETAFVGDTEFDMTAARDAAIPLRVGLLGARSEAQLLASGATHVVGTLDAVGALLLGQAASAALRSGG